MNLKYENELIKQDAEFALKMCEDRADGRHLERDYVIEQFLKEFQKLMRNIKED